MAQDASPIAQLAAEPADAIAIHQEDQFRVDVDETPAIDNEEVFARKPVPHRREQSSQDAVTEGVKRVMTAANFQPTDSPQSIQTACAKEIVAFCYKEAADAIVASEKTTNPDDVRTALRNVNMCLARNSYQLSQPCLAGLIQSFQLPAVPTYPAPSGGGGWSPPSPARTGDYRGGDGYRSSDERHDPSESRERRGHNRRIRHGDDSEGGEDGCVHPLVWVLVLPFFVVGLVVATKKAVTMFNKWRAQQQHLDARGVQSEEDYAPLKTQEPS